MWFIRGVGLVSSIFHFVKGCCLSPGLQHHGFRTRSVTSRNIISTKAPYHLLIQSPRLYLQLNCQFVNAPLATLERHCIAPAIVRYMRLQELSAHLNLSPSCRCPVPRSSQPTSSEPPDSLRSHTEAIKIIRFLSCLGAHPQTGAWTGMGDELGREHGETIKMRLFTPDGSFDPRRETLSNIFASPKPQPSSGTLSTWLACEVQRPKTMSILENQVEVL